MDFIYLGTNHCCLDRFWYTPPDSALRSPDPSRAYTTHLLISLFSRPNPSTQLATPPPHFPIVLIVSRFTDGGTLRCGSWHPACRRLCRCNNCQGCSHFGAGHGQHQFSNLNSFLCNIRSVAFLGLLFFVSACNVVVFPTAN